MKTSIKFITILRILLLIINFIFILLGLGLIITTCVLRWGNVINFSILDELKGIQNLNLVLNGLPAALIVYGCLVIVIGLIGFVGVWFSNKCLLILHECVVIIIFLVHLAGIIVVLVSWPNIELQFKKELNKTLDDINNNVDLFNLNFSDLLNLEKQCNLLLDVSTKFDCCGIMSPTDFNFLIRLKCCKVPLPNQGCLNLMIQKTKDYSIFLIVLPMGFIFLTVILSIILVIKLLYSSLYVLIGSWCPFLQKDINELEKVKHRATKLVPELRNLEYHERLLQMNLTNLRTRRLQGDLIQMYKIINSLECINLKKGIYYNLNSSGSHRKYNFRVDSQTLAREPVKKCSSWYYFLTNRIVNHWNQLPNEPIEASNINCFKAKLGE
ncbi:unnamed protein product [Brachionus calyciflorus]|uniref:Tetraspanin n=1 Tax=Brachionus calyciflorus TaxID=104777 RepID=A0A814C986_9BILA|nr:unnamed protein product [Brachionus calyciflorus]